MVAQVMHSFIHMAVLNTASRLCSLIFLNFESGSLLKYFEYKRPYQNAPYYLDWVGGDIFSSIQFLQDLFMPKIPQYLFGYVPISSGSLSENFLLWFCLVFELALNFCFTLFSQALSSPSLASPLMKFGFLSPCLKNFLSGINPLSLQINHPGIIKA